MGQSQAREGSERVFGEDPNEDAPFAEASGRSNDRLSRCWKASMGKRRGRLFVLVSGVVLVLLFVGALIAILYNQKDSGRVPYRNIIFMISDGYGPAGQSYTRYTALYDGNQTVVFDNFLKGTVRTFSASSLITDSAAGATAYSCGKKTFNGGIAVDPVTLKPMGTMLEAAAMKGMKTGLVVKSALSDATPAAFSSHVGSRASQTEIASQQLTKGIEVMLGGGRNYYNIDAYKAKGYTYVSTASEMNSTTKTPLLGLFAPESMSYSIDQDPQQPTLPQMVNKALSILQYSTTGFFLMIEGSRIDHAGHQNDPVAFYHEAKEYDETMNLVYNWAKTTAQGETLIVSVSDHDTGGLALGRWNPSIESYPPYTWDPNVILSFNKSCESLANAVIAGASPQSLFPASFNLTGDDINRILDANNTYAATKNISPMIVVIGTIISTEARLGWSTIGHTGVDINLFVVYDSLSSRTTLNPQGNMDNTAVGNMVAEKCNFDLAAATAALQQQSNVTTSEKTKMEPRNYDPYHPRYE